MARDVAVHLGDHERFDDDVHRIQHRGTAFMVVGVVRGLLLGTLKSYLALQLLGHKPIGAGGYSLHPQVIGHTGDKGRDIKSEPAQFP